MRNFRYCFSIASILCVLFGFALPVQSATISWDGGGDGVSWSDPKNWSNDILPGSTDNVVIALSSIFTVKLTADVTILSISLGGASGVQTLDATGFVLNLGTDSSVVTSNGILIIGGVPTSSSYDITINGPLAIYGKLEWSNGAIYSDTYYTPPGRKVVTIGIGGLMHWVGKNDRLISAAVNNQGTIRWESAGTNYYQGYSVRSSGLIEIVNDSDATFQGVGVNGVGPWIVTNTGTVRKTGLDTVTLKVELQTINGTVDLQQGTMIFIDGSRWENSTLSVAAGTTMLLKGNGLFGPHIIAGTLTSNVAGTMLLTGDFGYKATMVADTVMGGILKITGEGLQVDECQLGANFNPPTTAFKAPINRGLIRLVGIRDHHISGEFVNEDTLRWESGPFYYDNIGAFTNNGLFQMATDSNWSFLTNGVNGTRPGPFYNYGLVRKERNSTILSNVDLYTTGAVVEVQGGLLKQDWSSRWENATVKVSSGATLQLAGGVFSYHEIAGTLSGSPQGIFLVSGTSYGYWCSLMSDTIMGGILKVRGTGLQFGEARLGQGDLVPPMKAPVNQGLLRMVYNLPHYISGEFLNQDTIIWERGNLFYYNTAKFQNEGYMQMGADTDLMFLAGSGQPSFLNAGRFHKVGKTKTITNIDFQNTGEIATADGILHFDYPGRLDSYASGIISGGGILDLINVQAPPMINLGVVAPGIGDSGKGIATLTIQGLFPHHQMNFELSGTDSTLYDQLILTNSTPPLDSVISTVDLIGGFVPLFGDHFDIVHGAVTGKLQSVISLKPNVSYTDTYPPNLVRLIAGGIPKPVVLSAGNASAKQGEKVIIPIKLVDPAVAKGSGATQATTTLRFNSTLLVPSGTTPLGTISGNLRSIDLILPITSATDSILARLEFTATLGNNSGTQLEVLNATTNAPSLTLTKNDGVFTLLDICPAGGDRLLNPTGVASISAIRPNPASSILSFDLELIEEGRTTISLADISGRKVRTFIDTELPTGKKTMKYSIGDLAPGKYFLILETPSSQKIQPVEIVQ